MNGYLYIIENDRLYRFDRSNNTYTPRSSTIWVGLTSITAQYGTYP